MEGEIKNLKDGGQDQEPGKNERLKDTILKLKKLGRNFKEKNDKFKIYQVVLFKDISEKSTENEKLKDIVHACGCSNVLLGSSALWCLLV